MSGADLNRLAETASCHSRCLERALGTPPVFNSGHITARCSLKRKDLTLRLNAEPIRRLKTKRHGPGSRGGMRNHGESVEPILTSSQLLGLCSLSIAELQRVAGSNLRIERLGQRRHGTGNSEPGQSKRDRKIFLGVNKLLHVTSPIVYRPAFGSEADHSFLPRH